MEAPIPSKADLPFESMLSPCSVSLLLMYAVLPTKTMAEENSSGPLLSFLVVSYIFSIRRYRDNRVSIVDDDSKLRTTRRVI